MVGVRAFLVVMVAVVVLVVGGSASAVSPDVVISQVYGGGGNSGAVYEHDFIELFNRGSSTVSLVGWSVQYASATGAGNFGGTSVQLTELSGSLAPGQYMLIREASNAALGSPLPTPDITDATPISMSATDGKVALVNTTASLGCNGGSTPCSPAQLAQVVDLVGYGSANFFEGSGAASTLSNSTAALRKLGGCVETDDNSADLAAGTPTPRNTGSPLSACSPPEGSLVINEIDYDQPGTDTAEFIELKNGTDSAINLDDYSVELVNGTGGGATIYNTVDLPNVSLAAGDYYVICANASTVANCDLDSSPDTNFIQNGAPDAVGLRMNGSLVDAVSYEGDAGTPYTEGSGAGLEDDPGVAAAGISRLPDGLDTDQNNADFSLRCITPGQANDSASSSCSAPSTGPLVQVSGSSPFGPLAACGNFPGIFNGTNFLDSEVEPWVVVNPTNADNIVAFWQQDRWSDGGSRGNVAGVSFDGGVTWQIVPVPGLTDCSGGPWERSSDPWLSFGPDGTLHQMSLVFQTDPPPGSERGFGPNGMAVSKSEDGGLTWSEPILVAEDDNPRYLNDKNSITADPTDPDYVYAVWDRLDVSPGGIKINDRGRGGLGSFKGPAMIARSTDGGDTWEPAKRLYNPGGLNQTIGNQVVVLPDGTVIDFFNEILNFRNDDGGSRFDFNLSFKYSQNKGERWLPRGRPIRTNKIQSLGVVTPDSQTPVRDASILFDVAVDPASGSLYAVWQDARFSGVDEIAFSMSADGGFTWSTPIKVNQTPANANPLRQQAFIPSVEAADGTVGVTYYDFRNDDDSSSSELADHWFASCTSSCSDPANWDSELRLTDASFDYTQAPFANGLFLGDYVGLASDGTQFLSFFPQSFAADPANGYFRQVTP